MPTTVWRLKNTMVSRISICFRQLWILLGTSLPCGLNLRGSGGLLCASLPGTVPFAFGNLRSLLFHPPLRAIQASLEHFQHCLCRPGLVPNTNLAVQQERPVYLHAHWQLWNCVCGHDHAFHHRGRHLSLDQHFVWFWLVLNLAAYWLGYRHPDPGAFLHQLLSPGWHLVHWLLPAYLQSPHSEVGQESGTQRPRPVMGVLPSFYFLHSLWLHGLHGIHRLPI